MKRANKSKNNGLGMILGINRFTGTSNTVLVNGNNRMLRRMKGERGKRNG